MRKQTMVVLLALCIVTCVGPHTRNAGFSEIAVFAKEPDEVASKQTR